MRTGPNDFQPTASTTVLAQRAKLLDSLRTFFDDQRFIEVETPLVASEIIPELHIDPMQLADGTFLQSSPELHMKRLLAAGAESIYQVTRSFRSGERGALHNPEFTIVEWYRVGDDMRAGIDRLDALLQSLLGTPPAICTSYGQAFERALQFCPYTASIDQMAAAAEKAGLQLAEGVDPTDRDSWLNFLLAMRVEPNLGRDRPEIIYHYPGSQASLAKIVRSENGHRVAERFEIYYRGIELANGFHELGNADELRSRFEKVNVDRAADGRQILPMPERFLAAMQQMPDCTGVALGFDRLAMLAHGATSIDDVVAFPQERA
ncbi:MAG TPA: EF-P lysine aminoacylase EpmA [Lacipirellulaceae bacterium]|jgi:lysyl-tRNA synthetase class 2|nr:EF-P lysine aminoacylase EpmA [Lacipirellulaceae bacterium]